MSQHENQSSDQKRADEIRQNVRESYSQVAEASNEGDCCGTVSSCCGVSDDAAINTLVSTRLGYSEDDLDNVPEGADMGLGCGNPRAIASIQPGETILDLGSGGGFDCFLAAAETGESGRVIGIDMTPTMISKARSNAEKGKYNHVEFRLGEIEYLPVANDTVDVIISNCVINLSPDKKQVFSEAFRVLKPGGKMMCLEFSKPTFLPFRRVYDFYSFYIMPFLGELIAGSRKAYTHLPESIRMFPMPDELAALLKEIGFSHIIYKKLTNGIAVIHLAIK